MIAHYEALSAQHAGRATAERRLSKRIARFRLATFIPAAALLAYSIYGIGAAAYSVVVAVFVLALLDGVQELDQPGGEDGVGQADQVSETSEVAPSIL